jgi:phosphohistidine phosphatase
MIGRAISQIDLVLVSTATRAQQTWDLVRPGVSFEDARDVPELYLASADAMMRRIRAVDCDTLMLIAHNPGLEVLAERLSRDPESPVYRQMLSKFPTSAFALLEEDKPFSRWGYGAADLTAFEIARGK